MKKPLENILYDKKISAMFKKLSEDFHLLSSINDIYQREFPKKDKNLLNPFSLKCIGFRIYSKYALKDCYSTATDYFGKLLTQNDITDLNAISSNIKAIISHNVQLYKLKSEYEVVEFIPNKMINYRKLEEIEIAKEMLRQYCEDVINFVGEGKYFTLSYIRNCGFVPKLDKLSIKYETFLQ